LWGGTVGSGTPCSPDRPQSPETSPPEGLGNCARSSQTSTTGYSCARGAVAVSAVTAVPPWGKRPNDVQPAPGVVGPALPVTTMVHGVVPVRGASCDRDWGGFRHRAGNGPRGGPVGVRCGCGCSPGGTGRRGRTGRAGCRCQAAGGGARRHR